MITPSLLNGYLGMHIRDICLNHFDGDSFLHLSGRRGDLIKTSTGRRIAPARVEAALRQIPSIDQAIVVGDGRNNYNAAEAWVLDDVRRKAKRLLWICPEDRAAWGIGDSEMPLYAARCDRVATAATLEELEGIAEALVPRR